MKLLRGFLRLFFFLCHIQARKKCFFLAVEQVNGILLPPMVTSLPGSSSLELVLAVERDWEAGHMLFAFANATRARRRLALSDE